MNSIAVFFRTTFYTLFILLIFALLDIAIFFGARFLFSLSWFWFIVIMVFLWGIVTGLFKLLILGLAIGIAALLKPNPIATSIIVLILSILNFLNLAYVVWVIPGTSIWIIIAKLIATGFVFQINYFMVVIGIGIKMEEQDPVFFR